ncbi:conserved hypothetical protein [Sporisorium reilianum SRZ2]|uniref:Mediator complex subunit 16 n=1 Tax=Sporisorium reilianum (strain SRZ2) TaxID=999809 RepID=E6ZKN6_SPORE|nr:conserved hypothetical protein [Sporisorium reilianum SRZ2]
MSIETPAKRQRTADASSSSLPRKPSRTPLSHEQRQSIRHAKYIENGIDALEQLDSLRKGKADLGQIAWSPHNVLATASNSRRASSKTVGGHLVVQYPLASTSNSSLRPSYLLPDQPTFTSSSAAAASSSSQVRIGATMATPNTAQAQPTRYDDPTHISFSPCGYYLCAFFRATAPVTTTTTTTTTTQHGPSNATADGAALPPNGLAGATAPALAPANNATVNALSSSDAAASQPLVTSETPPNRPLSQLCFWSRADTGALNDWKLVQTLSVDATSCKSHASTTTKADNVLKVNDKGQPIAADASRASPSGGDPATDNSTLRGGVKQVVWLNRRRRIVLSSSSSSSSHYGASPFSRLAARGPSTLPAASASTDDSGPDQDVALVVFGDQGQVTLLSSRKADRQAASNPLPSSIGDSSTPGNGHSPFFTAILHSSLYTPSLQPSPITLDSTHSLGEHSAGNGTSHPSHRHQDEREHDREDLLTHLAVGMPVNDSVLLVASKRPSSSSSLVDLAEISIDLRADSVTMITRPLQSVALSSADHASSSDASQNGAADNDQSSSPVDLDPISLLTWAEVDSAGSNEDADTRKSGSLRLIACSSHLEAPASADPSTSTTPITRSTIAVWDLHKAENELSDAFASLECRKTGHAPKWLDWQLRFAQSKTLTNQLITSLVADARGIAVADLAVLTSLTSAPGEPGLLSEQLSFFDLKNVDLINGKLSPVPTRALSRSSSPVISSNGALVATFSSIHDGSSDKAVVMWKLPSYPLKASAEQTQSDDDESRLRMSQLFALSCLRKSDPSDITRAFASSASRESRGKLLIEIGDLLKITESKRQDVLVKIEGATQKGPSHDSNSIPFHQALRLLKVRMAMDNGKASSSRAARLERLVLELGLCYQVLRLARVKTEVTLNPAPPAAENGKKKSGAASKATAATATTNAGETRERVYYRLDSVWPLLAQLQWFLMLLDGISRLALATSTLDEAPKADTDAAEQDIFEADFVRMLNKPTPRRLVLQIVAHFCDFQEWISSTTKKHNLPPPTGFASAEETAAFFASSNASGDGRMLAVSEQMALARDALHRVVGEASIDLADFAHVLVKLEADVSSGTASGLSQSRETDRFWWATLDGGKLDQLGGGAAGNGKAEQDAGAAGLHAKLLSSIVDAQSGALVDVLTLFLSPPDILDERSVLYEKGVLEDDLAEEHSTSKDGALVKALSAMSAKRGGDDKRRDIVRKVSLQHAVTQSSLLNDASTLLRTHATTVLPPSAAQRLQPAFPAANEADASMVKTTVMRAKRCVRCGALSQDPICATYALAPPAPVNAASGLVVDASMPPQLQHMQMQYQMMQMQLQMQQAAAAGAAGAGAMPQSMAAFMPMLPPQPRLVSVEVARQHAGVTGAFRYSCLCGGAWWVL